MKKILTEVVALFVILLLFGILVTVAQFDRFSETAGANGVISAEAESSAEVIETTAADRAE